MFHCHSFHLKPAAVVLALLVFCFPGLAGGEWNFNTDLNNNVVYMTYINPVTQLNSEAEVRYQLSNLGTPESGTLKFKSGFERTMTQGELTLYWESLGGEAALWDNLLTRNALEIIKPSVDGVPASLAQRRVRVITTSDSTGNSLIGKITKFLANPDGLVLNANGREATLFYAGIKELQYRKR